MQTLNDLQIDGSRILIVKIKKYPSDLPISIINSHNCHPLIFLGLGMRHSAGLLKTMCGVSNGHANQFVRFVWLSM